MEDKTEFAPTENQRKAVRAAKRCNFTKSGPQVCKAIELTRQSWYDWMEQEGFIEWWTEQGTAWAKSRLADVRNAVVNASLEKAGRQDAKYNPAALKLGLDLIDGEYRRNAADAAANANTTGLQAFLEAVTTGKDATETAEATNADET